MGDRRNDVLSSEQEKEKKENSRVETTVACLLKSDEPAWRVLNAKTNAEIPVRLKASQLLYKGTLSTYALSNASYFRLSWRDLEEKKNVEIIPNEPGHEINVPNRWDMTHDPKLPGAKEVGEVPIKTKEEEAHAKKDRDSIQRKRYQMASADELQVTSEWLHEGKEGSYLPELKPTTDAKRSTLNHSTFAKSALKKNGRVNRGKNRSLF